MPTRTFAEQLWSFRNSWLAAFAIGVAALAVGAGTGVGALVGYGGAVLLGCGITFRAWGIAGAAGCAVLAIDIQPSGLLPATPDLIVIASRIALVVLSPWAIWQVITLPTEPPRIRGERDADERAFWCVWDNGLVTAALLLFIFVLIRTTLAGLDSALA